MDYSTSYQFETITSPIFLNKVLPYLTGKKVLDVGCGKGAYLEYFKHGSLGLDVSELNIRAAKGRRLRVMLCDLNKPRAISEKFDGAFLSHILEHVESPIRLLRYVYTHLNPGGSIVVSVPNEVSLIHTWYPYFSQNGNHLYSFSVANMLELLKVSGFSNTRIFFDYYTRLTTKLKLNKVLEMLDLLPFWLKNKLAWSYWFIAER